MRSGTRLFATYAVASLVPVLALGAVLANGNRQDGVQRGLESARAQAAVVEEMAVAPALSGELLSERLTQAEERRLQDATDLAIYHGSVVRLRLRDFDGGVVFSDDSSPRGALPAEDPDFVAAAEGATRVQVLDDGPGASSIRVVQPVIAGASGRSVGVLELELPYDAIAREVAAATTRTYQRLGVGLGLLYVVLALISWSTTRRLRQEAARAAHEALHDPLTGLGNRELFRHKVESATRTGSELAVVLVDLDRFKQVNDTLGHHAGDELLRTVAQRLKETLRTDDTVTRLGGDEFGLVLPGISGAEEVRSLLVRVSLALTESVELEGVPVAVEASFGVALHPRDGNDTESLLRAADAAMYQGKRGTSSIVVYDPLIESITAAAGLTIHSELRRALDRDELVLHYQPVVDLVTGAVTRLEALVRWQHPERGLVPPAEFVPAVEQSSLVQPFTRWVLARALDDCAAWTQAGAPWEVSVNVSIRNLDSDFPDEVLSRLRASGVDRSALHLEITETALGVDPVGAGTVLDRLAGYGVRTALDDFGVGYASLAHLRTLAVDEVKIDRGFVAGVETTEADREVVRSLVALAHGLGLTVTAEGIETEQAAEWLTGIGCDAGQGYWYARPTTWQQLVDHPRLGTRSRPSSEALS
jgi:diguanylate cyclase (GGDEF)-like protein